MLVLSSYRSSWKQYWHSSTTFLSLQSCCASKIHIVYQVRTFFFCSISRNRLSWYDPPQKGGLKFEIFNHDSFLLEHHGILYRVKQLWKKLKSQKIEKSHHNSKKYKKGTRKRSVPFNLLGLSRKKSLDVPIDASRGAYLWMQVNYSCKEEFKAFILIPFCWFQNMPIPLGAIFFQYMLLWKRLSAHYFSSYVFNCLLYGEPIKPIPKLQVILSDTYYVSIAVLTCFIP